VGNKPYPTTPWDRYSLAVFEGGRPIRRTKEVFSYKTTCPSRFKGIQRWEKMTLKGFPVLLSKSMLAKVYGVTISTLNRRIANGWGSRFEWYQDEWRIKATRDSVEADLKRGIERTCRRLRPEVKEATNETK
jgi:hypothetical protein